MKSTCLICNKEFYLKLSARKKGKGKYCSKLCHIKSQCKQLIKECLACQKAFNSIPSAKRKYCSRKCMGISERKRIQLQCLHCQKVFQLAQCFVKRGQGKYCSANCQYVAEDWRLKQSFRNRGSRCIFYLGGRMKNYPLLEQLRKSPEYVKWRTTVFQRDNYTCQICGIRGGRLNADHIQQFAYYPTIRFDINNGRTLCVGCHRKTDTYGSRGRFMCPII